VTALYSKLVDVDVHLDLHPDLHVVVDVDVDVHDHPSRHRAMCTLFGVR